MSISTVGLFFIPLFVKINNMEQQTDVFIPDGMNAFQRNVKRVGDCLYGAQNEAYKTIY